MNTNNIIKAYAVIITLVIILVMVWRAGYQAGQADTTQRVERVLDHEGNKRTLVGTFDAMCDEFAPEFR